MLGPRQQQPMSSEDLLASALDDSDFDELTAADLEDLYFRYTNNTVYVLDTSDSCGEVEGLVKLFGSPAGRALVETATTSTSTAPAGAASECAASSPLEASGAASSSPAPCSSAAAAAAAPGPGRPAAAKARRKQCRRSSAELYKEAAALLGLACSMTDSCRCIECQSQYFDCDDEEARADSSLAAGTPALLDHVLTHPMSCTLQ